MILLRSAFGLLGMLMVGPAAAATMPDTVPDLTIEDQAVKAIVGIYAKARELCVVRATEDMPPMPMTAKIRKSLLPGSFGRSPWKPSEAVSAEELASIETDYEAMVALPGLWARGRPLDPRILPDGVRFVDSVDLHRCRGTQGATAQLKSGTKNYVQAESNGPTTGEGGQLR